jgi:aconitate hydratase
MILAGKEYGSGSSRDWAAKGPCLLGIRAALAESFERIHRSNLVGMGILPLQFLPGQNVESLELTGFETYDIPGIAGGLKPGQRLSVIVNDGSKSRTVEAICRIDTPYEMQYYQHGGILQFVLRQLLG